MRYRLRTLLIVLALGPPVLAAAWWGYGKWRQSALTWEEATRQAAMIHSGRGTFLTEDSP